MNKKILLVSVVALVFVCFCFVVASGGVLWYLNTPQYAYKQAVRKLSSRDYSYQMKYTYNGGESFDNLEEYGFAEAHLGYDQDNKIISMHDIEFSDGESFTDVTILRQDNYIYYSDKEFQENLIIKHDNVNWLEVQDEQQFVSADILTAELASDPWYIISWLPEVQLGELQAYFDFIEEHSSELQRLNDTAAGNRYEISLSGEDQQRFLAYYFGRKPDIEQLDIVKVAFTFIINPQSKTLENFSVVMDFYVPDEDWYFSHTWELKDFNYEADLSYERPLGDTVINYKDYIKDSELIMNGDIYATYRYTMYFPTTYTNNLLDHLNDAYINGGTQDLQLVWNPYVSETDNPYEDFDLKVQVYLCAFEQDRGYAMYRSLHHTPDNSDYLALARQDGVNLPDEAKFSECISSERYADAVTYLVERGRDEEPELRFAGYGILTNTNGEHSYLIGISRSEEFDADYNEFKAEGGDYSLIID